MADSTIPSPSQLALALALVKHKPVGTTMKDYFTRIRQFIKAGTPTDRPTSRDQFFDSVAFWQKAYEKSEAEQSKLLDRIYELEQRSEKLTAKLHGSNAVPKDLVQGSTKRKATLDASMAGTTTSRKKSKQQTQTQSRACMLTENLSNGLDGQLPEYLEEPTASFVRRFYALQKMLQRSPNTPAIALATGELCSVAENDIFRAVQRQAGSSSEGRDASVVKNPSVSAVLNSIYSAHQLLLRALKKVPSSESALQGRGQIIFHIARLSETVIKALGIHCRFNAKQQLSTAASATKTRSSARLKRSKTGHSNDKIPSSTNDEVAQLMSLLLCRMALSLDRNCSKTSDLRNGFSYVLLSRVGELLCLFVFRDLHLRSDLEGDPTNLSLPHGLKDAQLDEESVLAAEIEAKHLISPLERLLTVLNPPLLPEELNCAVGIKGRLQSTLLQAVFGQDSRFGEALRPLRHDDTLTISPNTTPLPEQSVSEWFVQETWRLLGWDLVAGSSLSG
ncbi:uncharacterized protein BO72DRAFT_527139 [Aspergillus fijiensis CBS 313.89]|uniref:Uncharacterized protein n=1 Tax=Aspergillus fijiensis CBS 313.89 TaxID=1448319 RepID=A0A8G1RRL6_9EURO|nr:uncharacterized protein BO72DRAFT_527139 [Aspergillus fijiensis CBS 313.89]RAK77994.1 hypothetical protein BO72DRAFT_527139 [Aspergillus fijiensis CBS 313.89]